MDLPKSEELLRRAEARDPGRRQQPRARVPLGRRDAAVHRRAARARGSSTRTATATSTSCSRTVRSSSATRIRGSPRRSCAPRPLGTAFGAPTRAEVELAETITRWMPSVEQVRLVNSGTEATMSAIRLARAATGRAKIVKFDGQLPRPRRLVPREGGLGRAHAGDAGLARRSRRRSRS